MADASGCYIQEGKWEDGQGFENWALIDSCC